MRARSARIHKLLELSNSGYKYFQARSGAGASPSGSHSELRLPDIKVGKPGTGQSQDDPTCKKKSKLIEIFCLAKWFTVAILD